MKIGIHITHEAVHKVGGIGSVISGLCTADRYKAFFDRTVLYGPLFSYSADVFSRLGKGGDVLYSNHDRYDSGGYHERFADLIRKYAIDVVYGRRTLVNEFDVNKKNTVDVVLLNVNRMNLEIVNAFKFSLWERFGIESNRYTEWDYEQYVRIAVPYLRIIELLYPDEKLYCHFAHEYMGIPSALSVLAGFAAGPAGGRTRGRGAHRTVFYAHEVSPCRAAVENDWGHDIAFYSRMYENRKSSRSFEDEYGSQKGFYRSELVKASRHFDHVFAVSDLIKEEYLYLIPGADEKKIRVVYNGIPLRYIGAGEKIESRNRLRAYVERLFNFKPDIVFTHVTRLVLSKGIWRDITFLYVLDELFHAHGLKGAYLLLSSLIGTGRDPDAVARMEQEYGWPVVHRDGWPDLVGAENDINAYLSLFNARSRSIKGVFINQFGFNRRKCGARVPEDADFIDLRIGSDAEFGFSIYEPFGIAQLETVPFGGIAALSSSCGCASLLAKRFGGDATRKPYTIFPFVDGRNVPGVLDPAHAANPDAVSVGNPASPSGAGSRPVSAGSIAGGRGPRLTLTADQRFGIEKGLFRRMSEPFFRALPKSDGERTGFLADIQERLECLGWESIVESMNLSTL